MGQTISGVGVLDKSIGLLSSVADAEDPVGLTELVALTGMSRATTHRLAVALETHGMLRRDGDGRFALGLWLVGLGRTAAARWPVVDAARPALEWLRGATGESVQLYVRDGDVRACVDSLDSPNELRTIVDVGARLPLDRGSAGRVLLGGGRPSTWAESVEERAPGVASVSAAVRGPGGVVLAAVGISGPIERTTRRPGRKYGAAVMEAAKSIERAIAAR